MGERMNYEEMSDFEINKEVFKLLNKPFIEGCEWTTYLQDHRTIGYKKDGDIDTMWLRDFCNNPSDAWPIIAENKIDLIWDWDYESAIGLKTHLAMHGFKENKDKMLCKYEHEDENMLRAAMIVYLMMSEEK